MADANYQVMVEFLAKHDSVSKGLSVVAQGTDSLVQKNQHLARSFESMGARAAASFHRVADRVKASASTIITAGVGIGLAFTAAAGGILAIVSRTAESIDKITDSARAMGVSAREFQKLSYGASLSGVSMEELSGVLSKFNVNLGQALSGNQTAIDSFKSIGVSVDDLRGKDLSSQFVTAATAVSKLGDANKAASAGLAIFGRGYTTALNLGRDGITQNIREFEKLGATLTDAERSAVDAFGDSKLKLGAIFDVFLQKVTADVSPAFTKLIAQVSDYIQKSGGLGVIAEQFADKIISGVNAAINVLTSVYDKLSKAVKIMQDLRSGNLSDAGNGVLGLIGDTDAGRAGAETGLVIRGAVQDIVNRITGNEPNQAERMRSLITSLSALPKRGELADNSKTGLSSSDYFAQGLAPSFIPNYLQNSTVENIRGSANAVDAAINSVANGIQRASEKMQKSADIITGAFKALDDQATGDTLKEIMQKINDEGLVNPMTRTDTRLKTDEATGLYATDAQGNFIEEKYNVFPTATGTQFETDAAQIIADIKTGKYQGKDFSAALDSLRSSAANNAAAGLNNSGEIGILSEIKKFAENMGARTEKPQQVEITVSPTNDFIVKVAQNSYTQQSVEKYVGMVAADAASQLRGA